MEKVLIKDLEDENLESIQNIELAQNESIGLLQDENEDIIHMNEPLELNIDENYKYFNEGKIFSLFSNLLYYGLAFPVLTVLNKIVYDLKIEGKENIKNLKTGAISVSNHVLILDCSMIGLAFGLHKVYFTTREGSFKIPFVRKLIKLLRAVPIPSTINNEICFVKEIDKALQNGKIVHFYPEKALWPYCEKIRNFKNGAFNFAIKNDVPVIPIVVTFRNPKGIRKLFKKKKDVTVKILKPIKYTDKNTNLFEKTNKIENSNDIINGKLYKNKKTSENKNKNISKKTNENQNKNISKKINENQNKKYNIESLKMQVHKVMEQNICY